MRPEISQGVGMEWAPAGMRVDVGDMAAVAAEIMVVAADKGMAVAEVEAEARVVADAGEAVAVNRGDITPREFPPR